LSFTVQEGNDLLDSLRSRADWERAFQVRSAQLILEQVRHERTEALRRQDSLRCDSVFWVGQDEQKALIFENDELHESARRVPWIITLATLIGLVAGLVLAQ
jgi:hypothetical protein